MYINFYNGLNFLTEDIEPALREIVMSVKIDEFHDVYRKYPIIEVDGVVYDLVTVDSMIYFNGKYFGDYRITSEPQFKNDIVEFNKSMIKPTSKSPLNSVDVRKAITLLYDIELDGETMEHIVDVLGMKRQLLRQLVLGANIEDLVHLMAERETLK